jgi:ribonuclease BN (tRNA processing enzyme)
MDIHFVGTGGAFDYQYGNASAVVQLNGENYLIDCGHDVYHQLRVKDYIPPVDYLMITHFHADHVGSLSTFILHHHLFVKGKQLKILYPEKHFKDALYTYLSFSLQKPEKYIAFIPMETRPELDFINTFGKHVPGMQTYSYIFREGDQMIGYSGDTGDADTLFDYLEEKAAPDTTVFHDITFDRQNGSHTYFSELEQYAAHYPIYGYHCDPSQNPRENKIPLVHDTPEYML